jgi:Ca-activated chloride channel family protein
MLPPSRTPESIPSTFCAALLRACLVYALVVVAVPARIYPQAQQPTNDDEVLRVNTDLLVFPIRVKDKREPSSSALSERDLVIKDDDHAIGGFYLYQGADRVALVFALDQSGSLRDIVSQQSEAALALFSRFGEKSQVAVIQFAEQPALVAHFGRDAAALREAFTFPVRTNQHTAIFDAAAAAVNAFDSLRRIRSERRIAILISDGLDNASRLKAGQVIQAATQKHVSFYVIHLPLFEPRAGRLAVRPPAKGFRDLAEKTGGRYFLAGDLSSALAPQANKTSVDLQPIFQAIEEDLKSQYLLGFYAGEASRDGRKHRLKVSVPAGVEYRLWNNDFARTHEFFVNMPNDVPQPMKE